MQIVANFAFRFSAQASNCGAGDCVQSLAKRYRTTMKPIIKKLGSGSVILALLSCPAPVWAHARLDHATPAAGSTVPSLPTEITLYFTEELEPKFSCAEVRSAAG